MQPANSALVRAFARNLRKLREAKGISQEELAHQAGLDRTYVSGCERGLRNASLASVEKLAKALGCHPRDLLDT